MIRLARENDLELAAKIYDDILDLEEETISYTNWQKGIYPTIKDAKKAYLEGTFYVGEDDGIIWGSMILNELQLPEYANIPWTIETDRVLVIHTLCISPNFTGKGKAKEFVKFAEKYAKDNGYEAIRLDTYEGNLPANSMYPKLGYRYAGCTEFFFQEYIHEILNCYEKKI
ncbi:MAG: GNAT family N-acetyltransferase [Anaerolineaceae bacterium]|nr:MAG: GNAT family N-acetyltransferase [Anaerolineaceae bacterium]